MRALLFASGGKLRGVRCDGLPVCLANVMDGGLVCKKCLKCGEDISHKHNKAKYCDHICANHYHNAKRVRKNDRGLNRAFSDEDVIAIRNSSELPTAIAKKYGVTRQTVRNARDGVSYRHVK